MNETVPALHRSGKTLSPRKSTGQFSGESEGRNDTAARDVNGGCDTMNYEGKDGVWLSVVEGNAEGGKDE